MVHDAMVSSFSKIVLRNIRHNNLSSLSGFPGDTAEGVWLVEQAQKTQQREEIFLRVPVPSNNGQTHF